MTPRDINSSEPRNHHMAKKTAELWSEQSQASTPRSRQSNETLRNTAQISKQYINTGCSMQQKGLFTSKFSDESKHVVSVSCIIPIYQHPHTSCPWPQQQSAAIKISVQPALSFTCLFTTSLFPISLLPLSTPPPPLPSMQSPSFTLDGSRPVPIHPGTSFEPTVWVG